MPKTFDAIIVGLGAMGSAAAYHLAGRGLRVLGLDRFAPPHTMGSSHGESRIIREAYFEHPSYVPLVQRAYDLWADLEKRSGKTLFRRTAGLMLGPPEGVLVAGARHSAQVHDLRHEELDAREIRRRFPAFQPPPYVHGIWEPRAGALFPERCVKAYFDGARKRRAVLRTNETVVSWKSARNGVRVTTDKAEYKSRQLIISAGSWAADLLKPLDLGLTVERQVLLWCVPKHPALWKPARCPIYICEYAPGRFFYGFPDLGKGVKVAIHHEGTLISAEGIKRKVFEREKHAIHRIVSGFLPDLTDNYRDAVVCMYTNTRDQHFLIDRHPKYPQVLVLSPCSGHGFEFSSVIGEIAAELIVEGKSRFDLELFRMR